MMFRNKYRIVTDSYSGYEVQIRYWYSLFWVECGLPGGKTNTHKTIEQAERFAKDHSNKFVVVKEFATN